jgi:hypothetical protein
MKKEYEPILFDRTFHSEVGHAGGEHFVTSFMKMANAVNSTLQRRQTACLHMQN